MSRHLKSWPSTQFVRDLISDEEMARNIAELGSYDTQVILAKYDGNLTPTVINAWALFTATLQDLYPDAKMNRDFTVTRDRNREELEDIVIQRQKSDHYYHPDNYAVYTEDEITE